MPRSQIIAPPTGGWDYYPPGVIAAAFLQSDAFVAGIRGPIGSGKSTACVMKLLRGVQQQPPGPDGVVRRRTAIVRNSYPELKTTTIKTWHQWLPASIGHWVDQGPPSHRITQAGADGKLAFDWEVIFIALDRPEDVRKLLSMELSDAWINEAREVPKAALDGLTGRVGRYPAKRDGGCRDPQIIMDTNSPDTDHWWARLSDFPNSEFTQRTQELENELRSIGSLRDGQPLYQFFAQPGGREHGAENIPNLPDGYYLKAMAGKSDEWIKVYVDSEYGFVVEGRAVYPEYRDNIHCKRFELNRALPLYVGIDFGLCYDEQTEVLTDHGWKFFKDVDEHLDKAASRNPTTGALEYAAINFKIERDYIGDLIGWASTEVNFLVTPEHRVPFTCRDSPGRIHFESAQWLADHASGHHYVDLTSNWTGVIPVAPCGMTPEVFAAFLGWFVSDGSVEPDTNRIVITQTKPHADLIELLKQTGLDWHRSGINWRTSNEELAEYLKANGRLKRERHIPHEIHEATPDLIRIFLAAYTRGDGHLRQRDNGSQEWTIYTPTITLAGELQELIQKAGWNSALRVQRGQVSLLQEGNTVRQIVSGDGYVVTVKRRASRAELFQRNFRRAHYAGKIYCLNVPHHTLYIRRNGKPSWNGNTPAAVVAQRTLMGGWRVHGELITEDMGARRFGEYLGTWMRNTYRDFIFGGITGDPAGDARSQSDETTAFQMLRAVGVEARPAPTNDFTKRREAVAFHLGRIVEGEPGLIIHPDCQRLRKAMAGGYHYRRVQVPGDERFHDVPDKNMHSHVADSLQYCLMGAGEGSIVVRRDPSTRLKRPGFAVSDYKMEW